MKRPHLLHTWHGALNLSPLPPLPCRLQQADVNDPWVQTEWGRMLVAAGRHQEALAHLEAAGAYCPVVLPYGTAYA